MKTTQPQAKTRLPRFHQPRHSTPGRDPEPGLRRRADHPGAAGAWGADLSGRQSAPAPRGRDPGWSGRRLWRVPASVLDGPTEFLQPLRDRRSGLAAPRHRPGFAGSLDALCPGARLPQAAHQLQGGLGQHRALSGAGRLRPDRHPLRVGPGPAELRRNAFPGEGRARQSGRL